MHTYTHVQSLSPSHFKRLTGVSLPTFARMVAVVRPALAERQKHGGPRYTHSVEDLVLMTLTYWREYRTYFHLAREYGLSESQCFKLIKRIEEILIQDSQFHIPGKGCLTQHGLSHTPLLIDVAESPIERPKKGGAKTSKDITILGKRSAIRSKLRYSSTKSAPSSR